MKTLVSIFIISIISIQSFAQVENDKTFYEQKVIRYTKMKKTGTFLTIAGGILTTVGIAVLANSSIETIDDGYGNVETTTHGNPGLGAVTFLLGAGGLGSGIPLTIIGSKNVKKYESRLKSLSFKFNVTPNRSGIALTYKF